MQRMLQAMLHTLSFSLYNAYVAYIILYFFLIFGYHVLLERCSYYVPYLFCYNCYIVVSIYNIAVS